MNKAFQYFKGDELRASTWKNKYAAPQEESPTDMFLRVAKEFARIENKFQVMGIQNPNMAYLLSDLHKTYGHVNLEKILHLTQDFKFLVFAGSVLAGCGLNTPVSLSNCFVIGGAKDSYTSIMDTRKDQVQLMKRRGGVGHDLSHIRPRGAVVNNAAKTSTGAASYMGGFSYVTNEVAQDGRRGALMLSISIDHPDSPEFITSKQDLTKITGANISVKVSDEFMIAVHKEEDYILRYPIDLDTSIIEKDSRPFEYNKLYSIQTKEGVYYKIVKAKELWDSLMHCAWSTAEPKQNWAA